jgi:hypothetical protein
MLKTEWNKDKMQVDLEYTNKGKEDESDVAAVISVKSSIPDLRTASFNINHKSSGGRKYQNAMVLEYNGNTYLSFNLEWTTASISSLVRL